MKMILKVSSALAILVSASATSATDVSVGGNVKFTLSEGETINANAMTGTFNTLYTDDTVTSGDMASGTTADVTFKSRTMTRTLDYGAYVNFDVTESSIDDVDAHIRARFNQGTLRFGTDIDALQDAEDLDWVTVGPLSLTKQVSAAHADHAFSAGVQQKVQRDSNQDVAVQDSSITFTSNDYSGFTVAAEATPAGNGSWDWGASLAYEGSQFMGTQMKAVIATDSVDALMGNIMATYGDVSLNGFAGRDDDKDKYQGVAAAYDLGALTLSAGFSRIEGVSADTTQFVDEDQYVLGVAYEMAPGLTLDASAGDKTRYVSKAIMGNTTGQTLEARSYTGRIALAF